jgi:hypothetical protein
VLGGVDISVYELPLALASGQGLTKNNGFSQIIWLKPLLLKLSHH